jgi:RNA polymerase sigma factor (TIGR02999 family)
MTWSASERRARRPVDDVVLMPMNKNWIPSISEWIPTRNEWMSTGDLAELARTLRSGSNDAKAALDTLLPQVYDQLHAQARRYLSREYAAGTLTTTALVHETYMRLAQSDRTRWNDRGHFLAIASIVMRRLLVERARHQSRLKRSSRAMHVALDDAGDLFAAERAPEILDIDEALTQLEAEHPRVARVVECRYFAGLSVEESGEALNIGPATVKRDWLLARAWLRRFLAAT